MARVAGSIVRATSAVLMWHGVTEDESAAWLLELDDLGRRGEFFFSINRYLFVSRRQA